MLLNISLVTTEGKEIDGKYAVDFYEKDGVLFNKDVVKVGGNGVVESVNIYKDGELKRNIKLSSTRSIGYSFTYPEFSPDSLSVNLEWLQ